MLVKNGEVIFNNKDVFTLNNELISELKEMATKNERKTARICLHKNVEDRLHQMVIVHAKGAYIRPHKHPNKTESFHVIEGSFWVLIFNEEGNRIDKFKLSSKDEGDDFLLRIDKNIWHTVVPITDLIVFHEITNGPFTGVDDSIFAEWAPEHGISELFNDYRDCFEFIKKESFR